MPGRKTVLITGAAGALGSEVVRRFNTPEYRVLGGAIASAPGKPTPGVEWVEMDITRSDSIRGALAAASAEVDVLVHCAGGFRWALSDQISDADIDFLIDTNLKSSLLLAREVLPGMRKRNFGRIVFISSKQTLQPAAGMGAYAASKAGINMLTLALAEETKSSDITVNAVMPTIIDTPANRKDMPKADHSTWVPAGDLARIIFNLTQPESKAIHGALIPISGRV